MTCTYDLIQLSLHQYVVMLMHHSRNVFQIRVKKIFFEWTKHLLKTLSFSIQESHAYCCR